MERVPPSTRKRVWAFAAQTSAFIALSLLCPVAIAQTTVATAPVGIINLTIAAGKGSSPAVSVLSFPLNNNVSASLTGQVTGVITGVATSTISNASAGWTAGALSTPATPCLIQITSGSAAGRTFLISTSTANTSTTVTIDAQESAQVDLRTLGIAVGTDTYAIYGCDTLLSAFDAGTAVATDTTVLGSTSAAKADNVSLFINGAWRQYYYNTASRNWRSLGSNTVSDNVPIRPDTGAIYSRLANLPLALTVTGGVPTGKRQATVTNSGVDFISSSWPVDLTLGTSSIAAIPGWLSASAANDADSVFILVSGAWRQYYHDGKNWRRVGPKTISDSVAIPSGSAFMIQRKNSARGASILTQATPYTL